jgi:prevent-host-death family protein
MMKKFVREAVGLDEAKTQLSALVDRAAAGEEIVITKFGQPMARLVSMERRTHLRVPGQGKGAWKVAADFDAPLPDEALLTRDPQISAHDVPTFPA